MIEFWMFLIASFSKRMLFRNSIVSGFLAGTSPSLSSGNGWRNIVLFSDLVAAATDWFSAAMALLALFSAVMFGSSSSTIFSRVSRLAGSSDSAAGSTEKPAPVGSTLSSFLWKYDWCRYTVWGALAARDCAHSSCHDSPKLKYFIFTVYVICLPNSLAVLLLRMPRVLFINVTHLYYCCNY